LFFQIFHLINIGIYYKVINAFETKENIIDVDVYWSFNGDLEKENINNLSFNLSYFDEKKCVNTSYEDMFGKRGWFA
jgi:hypothetical protein